MGCGVQVRPPVQHRFGCGAPAPGEERAGVAVFRHRLLQHFMLSLFCKLPVRLVHRQSFCSASLPAHTEEPWMLQCKKCV